MALLLLLALACVTAAGAAVLVGGASVSASGARSKVAFEIATEWAAVPIGGSGVQAFLTSPAPSIGSPSQKFTFFVDTGSDVPWVYSSECRGSQVCSHARRYNHSRSSTYQRDGRPLSARYGAGTWTGFESRDRFNLTVVASTPQRFGWAYLNAFAFAEVVSTDWEGGGFATPAWDGFLALTAPRQRQVSTFQTDLIEDGFIAPVAAVDSSRGVVEFGGAARASQLAWAPLVPSGQMGYYWWQVQLDDILVGGRSTGVCADGRSCQAMFDTGAGAVWMMHTLGSSFQIPASVPCSQVGSSVPSISLVIAGRTYTVPAKDLFIPQGSTCYNQVNQQVFDDRGSDDTTNTTRAAMAAAAAAAPEEESPHAWRPSLAPRPTRGVGGQTLVHMGAPWFRAIYTALDAGANRVGFAPN